MMAKKRGTEPTRPLAKPPAQKEPPAAGDDRVDWIALWCDVAATVSANLIGSSIRPGHAVKVGVQAADQIVRAVKVRATAWLANGTEPGANDGKE